MLRDRKTGYRCNGGIEVEVGDLLLVVLALGNKARHRKNGRYPHPSFLLSASPLSSPVGGGGSFLTDIGSVVAGEDDKCVLAKAMFAQSFGELSHLVVDRDDCSR